MRSGAEGILILSAVFLSTPRGLTSIASHRSERRFRGSTSVYTSYHFIHHWNHRLYVPSFERRGLRELCSRASSATCVLSVKRSNNLQIEVSSGCENLPTMRLIRARP